MAHHCMGGLWKPTPIVSGGQETLRVLTRNRLKLVANRLELTNRISTRLTQYGITFTAEYAGCKPVHWLMSVKI